MNLLTKQNFSTIDFGEVVKNCSTNAIILYSWYNSEKTMTMVEQGELNKFSIISDFIPMRPNGIRVNFICNHKNYKNSYTVERFKSNNFENLIFNHNTIVYNNEYVIILEN